MSNKKYDDDDSIPTFWVIVAMLFCFPLGIALLLLKIFLPEVRRLLRGSRNRYSPYEKARRDAFDTEFRDKTGESTSQSTASSERPSQNSDSHRVHKVSRDEPKKTSAAPKPKNKLGDSRVKLFGILGAVLTAVGIVGLSDSLRYLPYFYPRDIAVPAIVLATGVGFGISAITRRAKLRKWKKYTAVIGERGSVSIDELVSSLGVSRKKVQRELQSAIEAGVFGEYAYIDMSRGCFMRNSSYEPAGAAAKDDGAENISQRTEKPDDELDEYNRTINEIIQLNIEIEDEVVSEKIDLIENYTRRIFDCVREDPSKLGDIRTFMTYYLPTTLKLLGSYSEIERVGVAGDNMKLAKENIEKTLDMLVEAFKRQLDMLYRSDSIDISSDIEVLEQMMRKDGLSDDGFGSGTATMNQNK